MYSAISRGILFSSFSSFSFLRSIKLPFIFTRWSIHVSIHTYKTTFIHTSIHNSIHIFIRTFILSFIRSFLLSFILQICFHSFIDSFIHSFIHSYLHPNLVEFEEEAQNWDADGIVKGSKRTLMPSSTQQNSRYSLQKKKRKINQSTSISKKHVCLWVSFPKVICHYLILFLSVTTSPPHGGLIQQRIRMKVLCRPLARSLAPITLSLDPHGLLRCAHSFTLYSFTLLLPSSWERHLC